MLMKRMGVSLLLPLQKLHAGEPPEPARSSSNFHFFMRLHLEQKSHCGKRM
jgi:hypothetical protein